MTGVWITLALGAVIVYFDYKMETKPDPSDKHKRPRKLTPTAKSMLKQMIIGTFVAAGAVYLAGQMFD